MRVLPAEAPEARPDRFASRLRHDEPNVRVIAFLTPRPRLIPMPAIDPLDGVTIRVRHFELLETLREMLANADQPGKEPGMDDLRAILAFLRQSVVPFARWEESRLRPYAEVWEGATLDHAFLEAEIDRLGRDLADLIGCRGSGVGTGPREGTVRRLLRTLWRIEAVLELHMLREEERGTLVPASGPGPRITRE